MKKLWEHQWFHRLLGHTIISRPATVEDECITHTVTDGGLIAPIMLDVCSCGGVW